MISVNFEEAMSFCKEAYNSSLVTIFTSKQNDIISKLCESKGIGNCWIGLHKEKSNNNWYWIENNMSTNFTKWKIFSNANCAEITSNPYKMNDDNDISEGDWNQISCDMLRHPICNDPFNVLNHNYNTTDLPTSPSFTAHDHQIKPLKYNRKLLQTQNISCNWTQSDNDTCIIHASHVNYHNIECDPMYPNCEINIANFENSIIYCPQNVCLLCVINCFHYPCNGLEIKGGDCEVVSILTTNTDTRYSSYQELIIHSPGNGGVLQITADMELSNIYSSTGTADIIVDIYEYTHFRANTIDAQFITRNMNFTCIGSADCAYTNIVCGSSDTQCNIKCSSSHSNAACNYMQVNVSGRTSNINWYCDNYISTVCVNAKLQCGDVESPKYSLWRYNDLDGWHYITGDCVKLITAWTAPKVTCNIKTDDTCHIIRSYLDSTRDIQCDNDLTHCQVQLGDDLSIQQWPSDLHSNIYCPTLECDSCIIQCISDSACQGITIYGYNCSSLQVNMKAIFQESITIWAPGNGGDLILLTDVEQSHTEFTYGQIISASSGTRNMIINFDDFSYSNFIDGRYVTDYLNVTCGINAYCYKNAILCPNDASCNIDCKGDFSESRIAATEGTHDVNWHCTNGSNCNYSNLYCYDFYNPLTSQSSAMQHVNGKWELTNGEWIEHIWGLGQWQLHNKTNGCVDIPTIAPTASPTSLTTSPTLAPTTAPTQTPSISPSASPTIPSEAPTIPPSSTSSEMKAITEAPEFWGGIGGSSFVIFMIIAGMIYYYNCYRIEKESLYITNGLVILIGIGEYDIRVDADSNEIGGYLRDLSGIEHDIKNMVHLFHDELNYDIFPSQYLDDIKNGYSPKQHWTEQELNDFLVDTAEYLEKNIDEKKYDGLIVVISCHGIPGYICTSNYRKFSKVAVHRIFSSAHPNLRRIPRLFLFDCCSGNNEQEMHRGSISELEDSGKRLIHNDIPKQVSLNDVNGDGDIARPWVQGEYNPDHRLAIIEAANYGFQSKIRNDVGSYVIYLFYKKTMDILRNNKKPFIHKTFDEIQDELQKLGKQHPTTIWNTDTRYIRFKRGRDENRSESTQIEMTDLLNGGVVETTEATVIPDNDNIEANLKEIHEEALSTNNEL